MLGFQTSFLFSSLPLNGLVLTTVYTEANASLKINGLSVNSQLYQLQKVTEVIN